MNVPRFIVSEGILAPCEGVVRLGGDEARHMTRVLRLGPGDRVKLIDGAGYSADAVIVSSDGGRVELKLTDTPVQAADVLPVELVVAVVKGDRMNWLVRKATELGVRAIHPVITEYTVVRLDPERRKRRLERWRNIAAQALKQCRGFTSPRIHPVASLAEALEELEEGGMRIVLWERENQQALLNVLGCENKSASVTIAVGPEGGFALDEISAFRNAGFVPTRLGKRILRAETAAIAAAAVVGAVIDAAEKEHREE